MDIRMPESSTRDLSAILDTLHIVAGSVIFVHSSMNWIGGGVAEARALIDLLLARVGKRGTVVMPAYVWRGAAGHPDPNGVIDLRREPCAVGLLPEVFRRFPESVRSDHWWVSICARGEHAHAITEGQADIMHPFGPSSSFRRLLELDALAVGLGVSLNTGSLSHLPDYELCASFELPVFTEHPLRGRIITTKGEMRETQTFIVRPELMRKYRPSIVARDLPQLACVKSEEAVFFSYPIAAYHAHAVRLGAEHIQQGKMPPWMG